MLISMLTDCIGVDGKQAQKLVNIPLFVLYVIQFLGSSKYTGTGNDH